MADSMTIDEAPAGNGGLEPLPYEHGGTTLHGLVARPEGATAGDGPRPGIMIVHHAMGQCLHDCERARDLAALGYTVLVTDMYGWGLRQVGEAEYVPVFTALHDDVDHLRGRVRAGFDTLLGLPDVDAARTGGVGFCFGGECLLELARDGAQIGAVVSLHGLLTTSRPAVRGRFHAKALVCTGAKDPYAPPEHVAMLQAELDAAEVDYHLTSYGLGFHAFSDPAVERQSVPGVRYDPVLDRLSWAQTTAFLDEVLAKTGTP